VKVSKRRGKERKLDKNKRMKMMNAKLRQLKKKIRKNHYFKSKSRSD